jgi:hypothetical protein
MKKIFFYYIKIFKLILCIGVPGFGLFAKFAVFNLNSVLYHGFRSVNAISQFLLKIFLLPLVDKLRSQIFI